MPDFTFNVAKGRTREFHDRVNNNDPAASALKLLVLANAAIESDDLLKDYDTVAAILAGASNEVTNAGYVRIALTDADLIPPVIDDVADNVTLPFVVSTFGSPNVAAGDAWDKLIVCYDADTAAGTDADLIPISAHELRINGQVIVPSAAPIQVSGTSGYVVAR